VTGPVRDRLAAAVLYTLALGAVFTIALSSLTEFDFWWYLASAERILATRGAPDTDPSRTPRTGGPGSITCGRASSSSGPAGTRAGGSC
jgi:hypothetical protein